MEEVATIPSLYAYKPKGRYPLHDAVEDDDIETIILMLGKKKTEENAVADKPVDELQKLVSDVPADQEVVTKAVMDVEEEEDSEDADDKEWGEDDDDEDEEEDAENEVNLDELDDSSCTPLHTAILNGSMESLKYLLDQGADTGIGCEGSPLMHMAVSVGSLEKFREFSHAAIVLLMTWLGKIDMVTIKDDFRRTPLHLAADLGLFNVTQELLDAFLNDEDRVSLCDTFKDFIFGRDKLGNTALHMAAMNGHAKVVECILKAAKAMSDDDLCSPLCMTSNYRKNLPLHFAMRQGYGSVVSLLLEYGNGPEMLKFKNIYGKSPKNDAFDYGHRDLLGPQGGVTSKEDFHVSKDYESTARVEKVKRNKTMIVRSDTCERHYTCRPVTLTRGFMSGAPPENVMRLKVLTDNSSGGILTTKEFSSADSDIQYIWENDPPRAKIADVLTVHNWHYVQHVKDTCEEINEVSDDIDGISSLDGDTTVSRFTFDAALTAAGASIMSVDKIMEEGSCIRNAFCAVRPPGHHAGPSGAVPDSGTDPSGISKGSRSHGFCLLNNVAIAASYAMNVYRKDIKKVAIVDFDVHHGNGTEACVSSVVPTTLRHRIAIGGDGSGTNLLEGFVKSHVYKPWLDDNDFNAILFASCQGYGESMPGTGHMFYPGTGATIDTKPPMNGHNPEADTAPSEEYLQGDHEFAYTGGARPSARGPRIINVGIRGPGSQRNLWRRAWRDKILPAVANHDPDFIFISAGFDAHAKDDMNLGYIGMLESDYTWVTSELVKIANKCCKGRIVSILEGGYRIQGGLVSPFARSVASHVRALGEANYKHWRKEDGQAERAREIQIEEEKIRKRQEELRLLLAEQETHLVDNTPKTEMQIDTKENGHAPKADAENGIKPEADEGPSSGKRKRRSATSGVDYAALNAELEKEEMDRKKLQSS